MSDHDALLAAILDNRADDTPRLVYADYLENDAYPLQPERGEFIRVQCELARWGRCDWKTKHIRAGYVDCNQWNDLLGEGRVMTWCPTCARRNELRRRERELWVRLPTCKVFVPWCGSCIPDTTRTSFRFSIGIGNADTDADALVSRGFVSSLTCSWSDWLAHHAGILARQPIEKVGFTGEDPRDYGWNGRFRRVIQVETGKIIWKCHDWPAIEFELPNDEASNYNYAAAMIDAEIRR